MVIERLDGTYEESDPETGQFPKLFRHKVFKMLLREKKRELVDKLDFRASSPLSSRQLMV